MLQLSETEFLDLASRHQIVPVYKKIQADSRSPVALFACFQEGPFNYLLESAEQDGKIGRYSFIGLDYYEVIKFQKGILTRSKPASGAPEPGQTGSSEPYFSLETNQPLEALQEILEEYQGPQLEDLPLFYGGAVGYLSYDMAGYFEDVANPDQEDDLGMPEMFYILSDTLIIYDHLEETIKIVKNIKTGSQDRKELQNNYHRAKKYLEEISARIAAASRKPAAINSKKSACGEELLADKIQNNTRKAGGDNPDTNDFTSSMSPSRFKARVRQIKDHIARGDIFQAVLSQRLSLTTRASGFEIYQKLRRINPSPYMYYLDLDEFEIIGSSPEVLVRVEDGVVYNRPLAGTRKRGKDPAEDENLARDLKQDKKERAEHMMLVDLGRNDVGRVSSYGTVQVEELMGVEYYSHVMHLFSSITGNLSPDSTPFQALEACFPAGTVSGAPKIKAMEIINRLEPVRRGPYAGSLGYFGYSGNLDSCITIRTILLQNETAHVQAGAGIVHDSQPEKEYQETLDKAEALLQAVREAGGERK